MAKSKKKHRVRRETIQAATDMEECAEWIKKIGELKRVRDRIKADMNDEIEGIKEDYNKDVRPLNAQIDGLSDSIQAFCETNRPQLFSKQKTYDFGTGVVKLRITPPKVYLRGKKSIIEKLHSLGLEKYIRVKEDVNKEAMLADRDKIEKMDLKGVSIKQKEDFIIEPAETDVVEEAA